MPDPLGSSHHRPLGRRAQLLRVVVATDRSIRQRLYDEMAPANSKANYKTYEAQARMVRAIVAAHPDVKWNYKGKSISNPPQTLPSSPRLPRFPSRPCRFLRP